MIIVADKGSIGIQTNPHTVTPVKVEYWKGEDHNAYYKTFAIDPATGTMREMKYQFWNKVATFHIIFPPPKP